MDFKSRLRSGSQPARIAFFENKIILKIYNKYFIYFILLSILLN
jgi:hypothetical protein